MLCIMQFQIKFSHTQHHKRNW